MTHLNAAEIAGLIVTMLMVLVVIVMVCVVWAFAGTYGVIALGMLWLSWRIAVGGK